MQTRFVLTLCLLTAIALAALCLLPIAASAQTDQGRIAGTVSDSNGALVPGSAIIVSNEKTGDERTTTTNEVGHFTVSSLRPSTYTITANARDLSATTINIQVLVGQEVSLPLTMQPTGLE